MRDFTFDAPDSLNGVLGLLEKHTDDARLIAGGTALVTMLKQSLVQAGHIVSLHRVPGLAGIELRDGALHIGALTSHRDVETSPLVREHAPLLAQVYSRVATVRIRNMATVGGGLAHADPAQDPLPGLLVLDATARLVSSHSQREVPVGELFLDYYETAIAPDEVLTEVIVPVEPQGARSVYLKYLPRSEDDYATVCVATMASLEGGRCQGLRVALGSVASTPIRATAVEEALEGQKPSADLISRAAQAVAPQVDPMDDTRGSAEYKRDMAVVFTGRALSQVLELDR
jgi:carbon-monoxide dehydrogenase medium subunit